MSFAAPLVLLGLLILPVLAGWYLAEQRRRTRAAGAFTSAALIPSVAPRRPGARRHVPLALLALALALLIGAAARPQVHVRAPIKGATVMLVNDVSASMTARDVSPSRLAAAQKAATTFTRKVPASIAIGAIAFARRPTLLASPSSNHAVAASAIARLRSGGGGTAIGEAIDTALTAIDSAPKVAGKRPPGAIVLLSDGSSNVGISPLAAAAEARRQKVRIDTIAIGTAAGTITGELNRKLTTIPVPVSPGQLRAIAEDSGGTFYSAPDQASAGAIYAHLAQTLGRHTVERGLIGEVAAAGLVLVLIGGGLSLRWFGALA